MKLYLTEVRLGAEKNNAVVYEGEDTMKHSHAMLTPLSLLLALAMTVTLPGCISKIQAFDLMEGVEAEAVSGKEPDEPFINSQMRFSLDLFKACVSENDKKNVLISPLSAELALAMTANGARGDTREEMESLLAGELSLDELNKYLYSYVNGLPSDEAYKMRLANSIWFRNEENRLTVRQDFLQKNADYYGAAAFQSAFNDQTLADINEWVNRNTDGMIDHILDRIEDDAVLYLINTLVFDAEWQTGYERGNISEGTFTSANGERCTVEMMRSTESRYLDDGAAIGFIKDYKDRKYSFVALLPDDGIELAEYIAALTPGGLLRTIQEAKDYDVLAALPKFSDQYSLSMNEVLKAMGMPTAFSSASADFTGMAHSKNGNIFIGEVLHKTFISVDELGTQAGAATKVEMKDEAADIMQQQVVLDRPFLYLIIDNETNLPFFMGTVTDIQQQ